MATKPDLTVDERIHKERLRLRRIYKNLSKDKFKLVEGLMYRAAFMRVQLEDYEKDILENGSTEQFSQSSKTEPYDRERPVMRLYNSTSKSYNALIKQMSSFLPKDDQKNNPKDDEVMRFKSWSSGRDE